MMELKEAAKKVYEEGVDGVEFYDVDKNHINLDCKGEDGRRYQANLIFDNGGYTYIKVFGSDAPIEFGDKVMELIK